MNVKIQTDWIKPPHQIGGLDHLGVQAPSIDIYGQLLPGITNVTDRARYYSFYPWLFWTFQQKGWKAKDQLVTMFRRADCLFTLIATRHDQVTTGESSYSNGTVGKNTLEPKLKSLIDNETIKLSDYSHQKTGDDSRYFKAKFGGLGQYYFGALRDLHLLGGTSVEAATLINEIGGKVAKAFEVSVPSDLFIHAIETDSVSLSELDKLVAYSPYNLKHCKEERDLLTSLFQSGISTFINKNSELDITTDSVSANSRSSTMAYQILLTKHACEHEYNFTLPLFRSLTYSQYGIDKTPFKLPEPLHDVSLKWQVYSRSEMLSLSLQGIFYAMLHTLQPDLTIHSTLELSHFFWTEGVGAQVLKDKSHLTTSEFIASNGTILSDMSDWQNENHEIYSLTRILELTKDKASNSPEDLAALIQHCLTILSALCYREENKIGYGSIEPPIEYLARYPVNLNSVMLRLNEGLCDENITNAMVVFTQQYCLENHWRVAMRKLRQQSQNTFRFEASERGLIVNAIPPATQTSPRFYQSMQIMQDLGLMELTDGLLKPTKAGNQFVENVI